MRTIQLLCVLLAGNHSLFAQQLVVHNNEIIYHDTRIKELNSLQELDSNVDSSSIATTENYFYNKVVLSLTNNTSGNLYILLHPKFIFANPNGPNFDTENIENISLQEFEDMLRFRLKLPAETNSRDQNDYCFGQNFMINNSENFIEKNRLKQLLIKNLARKKLNDFIDAKSIILKPNQRQFFVIYLSLPIYNFDEFESFTQCHFLDNHQNQVAVVQLHQKKEMVQQILSKKQLKQLKKRDIQIFDGTLSSNKIQIKKK